MGGGTLRTRPAGRFLRSAPGRDHPLFANEKYDRLFPVMNTGANTQAVSFLINPRELSPSSRPATTPPAQETPLSDHENRLHFFDRFAKDARKPGLRAG